MKSTDTCSGLPRTPIPNPWLTFEQHGFEPHRSAQKNPRARVPAWLKRALFKVFPGAMEYWIDNVSLPKWVVPIYELVCFSPTQLVFTF